MNRRLFLRSAAATLWLPMLPSILPREARAQAADAPRRMVFWFVPNGMVWQALTPDDPLSVWGAFEPVKDRVSSLAGLENVTLRDYASHEAGTSTLLSDRRIGNAYGGGPLDAGITADQVVADAIGAATPAPSLQLGLDERGLLSSGNSGLYTHHISWAEGSRPLPKITEPRRLFQKMYAGSDPIAQAENNDLNKSVLDAVLERATRLRSKLGEEDKDKLDQYMDSVRAYETSTEAVEEFVCPQPGSPGSGLGFVANYRAFADLTVLALQCDYTRVVSFMTGPSVAYTVYDHLGHGSTHHDLSHANGNGYTQFLEIHEWHCQQMAQTLLAMSEIPEGEGDLLSNTVFTLCSEFGTPNVHNSSPFGMVLGGGESAGFTHRARSLNNMPHSNYLRALIEFMGVNSSGFGTHATGTLDLT